MRTPKPRTSASERVREAEAELARAEGNLERSATPLRSQLDHHRSAAILIGGFATGVALTLLPTRWWGRIGAAFGTAFGTLGAAAARSLLTPAFMGAAVAKMHGKKGSAAAGAAHEA